MMTYRTGDSPPDMIEEPDCPHERNKETGDETFIVCELNDKPCLREAGYECETYDEWLEEKESES